jgi:hypothetical protein
MGVFEWLIIIILWAFAVMNFDFDLGITPTSGTGQRIIDSWEEFKQDVPICFGPNRPEEESLLDCLSK